MYVRTDFHLPKRVKGASFRFERHGDGALVEELAAGVRRQYPKLPELVRPLESGRQGLG